MTYVNGDVRQVSRHFKLPADNLILEIENVETKNIWWHKNKHLKRKSTSSKLNFMASGSDDKSIKVFCIILFKFLGIHYVRRLNATKCFWIPL